jgi:quercetin dioxygenase-like cupin family protein
MFTIRLRFPAGYTVPPHHHPSDEFVTVIAGQTSFGMGPRLNRK